MEKFEEKENSFFEISHINYDYVKNSELIQNDPLLQIFAETRHFKSLEKKTQGTQRFLCGEDVSTRLSHTYQVMQLSKETAENIGADVETAVRIATFHDSGHLPFGHIGEKAMKNIIQNVNSNPTVIGNMLGKGQRSKIKTYENFNHERMSAMVFEKTVRENNFKIPQNLTILEGILKHGDGMLNSTSVEGKIVGISDKLAYLVQDIKDSQEIGWKLQFPKDLGDSPEEILHTVMKDIKSNTGNDILISKDIVKNLTKLKKYMYENFYASHDFDLLDRMLGNILQHVFLNWCSEIHELREDIETGTGKEFYKDFFKLEKDKELISMLNFNNSFLQFISLSDEDILARSEYKTKKELIERVRNYKTLGIVKK